MRSEQMNNIIKPIINNNSIYQALPGASTENIEDSFKKVLSAMLLESAMSGMGINPNSEGISSTPLMLLLLEQLISRQVEPETETEAVNSSPAQNTSQPFGRPVEGVITQNSHNGHVAIDIAVPTGTQVHSTMAGKVVYAGWNDQGYGNLVIVENGPYQTYYAHLSKVPVSVGQSVSAGSTIGLSGSTGNSTGPHVHYEVRLNKEQINPAPFMFTSSTSSGSIS